MKESEDRLNLSLSNIHELENFVYELESQLGNTKLKQGEDLYLHAAKLKLKVPDFLEGIKITYDKGEHSEANEENRLILVRPSRHEEDPGTIQKIRLFCVRVGSNVKVCLECGWIFCRIVIIWRGNP